MRLHIPCFEIIGTAQLVPNRQNDRSARVYQDMLGGGLRQPRRGSTMPDVLEAWHQRQLLLLPGLLQEELGVYKDPSPS
jgi:hypothetical protein